MKILRLIVAKELVRKRFRAGLNGLNPFRATVQGNLVFCPKVLFVTARAALSQPVPCPECSLPVARHRCREPNARLVLFPVTVTIPFAVPSLAAQRALRPSPLAAPRLPCTETPFF